MWWVAFVRNVMVGRGGLDRAALLDTARAAGGRDAASYLTTGNLTFRTDHRDADRVADALETAVAEVLGRRELVAVRPLPWLRAYVVQDHVSGWEDTAWELEVALLRHDAPPVDVAAFGPTGRTVVIGSTGREVVTARPRAGGDRPHVNRLVERASGLRCTARGWSTLERVAQRAPDA